VYEEAVVATQPLVAGSADAAGSSMARLEESVVRPCPQQRPLPVWLWGPGGAALARAASLASGWIGSGAADLDRFGQSVQRLRQELGARGRDPGSFTIAKRVYIHLGSEPADGDIAAWSRRLFGRAETGGRVVVSGPPARCVDELERLVAAGAQHLILDQVLPARPRLESLVTVVIRPLVARLS
jgi:alkanesulfonate monooxygenase SsuD/methylene tetrahydromethanopterin reductase-like flavin-dependent oxidoreductase (luciferase family)